MNLFFKDIFEYHHDINQLLIGQMQDNVWAVSQYAEHLLSHSLNAHQIWNARILQETKLGVNDKHTYDACFALNKETLSKTMLIIENRDLQESVFYKNTKGLKFKNTIQQILFHISNHYSHHRGQLISDLKQSDLGPIKTDLYQQGLEPIISDYIFHRRTAL